MGSRRDEKCVAGGSFVSIHSYQQLFAAIALLQVWMRPGSQVMIQKLYARVDVAVEAGAQVTLVIRNRYNTYDFSGAKSGADGGACGGGAGQGGRGWVGGGGGQGGREEV